ncbi:MAG: TIGR03032 family protein [Desulfobacteraceae bacterium]|nr:TIGR03032 family protein [Desulfobacteraceae bacterium]
MDRSPMNDGEIRFEFGSVHTDNFPGILKGLNISLAVTSYQAQRLFFVRSAGEQIDTCFKSFPRPMGIYADRERLTLGSFTQVLEFKRNDDLLNKIKNGGLDNTEKMPRKLLEKDPERMKALKEKRKKELENVKKADSLYFSRASLTTGMINIHDIAWGNEGLWVVNSTFSCLSTLSPDHSFVARWKPPFIDKLVPEDRCHLNGMAMKDGKPKYVTTFNKFNERDSWVKNEKHNGTLIDVETNEILLEGLIMPHSPRYYNGMVYLCESGTGKVLKFDPEARELSEVIKLQGFPRGVNFYGPLMFVGLSKTRASNIKNPIPISKEYEETFSGIWIINLEDNREVGHIKFNGDLDQIYDIAVIPDSVNPELLNINDSLIRHSFDFKEIL